MSSSLHYLHDRLQMQDIPAEGSMQVCSTKRPQTCISLSNAAHLGDTWPMRTMSRPPAGDERQLVFTSSQAARYLGVSLATIRRWTDAGHISCYRTPGGQRRFSKDQLDGFVDSLQSDDSTHTTPQAA
jgi:excisionase family DNA binding protein